jgi:hypothetical protein
MNQACRTITTSACIMGCLRLMLKHLTASRVALTRFLPTVFAILNPVV